MLNKSEVEIVKIEKGNISSSELIFLIGGFIQGSILLTTFVLSSKHDIWIAILFSYIISIPVIFIYIFLAEKFPGKNLVQINDIILGKYFGKIISLMYCWFFYSLVILNLRNVESFFTTYIIPETPPIVIAIMFIFVSAWAVIEGIEVIARNSYMAVIITVFIIVLTFILLLKQMDFSNFLPIFEIPINDFVSGVHTMTIIPFCEIFAFMMIYPSLNQKKAIRKSTFIGFTIGAVSIFVVSIRDVAILGNLATIMYLPSYEALRMLDIENISNRLEVLDAIILLITMFLKITVLYYATVLCTAHIFNLKRYRFLVSVIGILCISYSLFVFGSVMEHMFWGAKGAAVYSTFFEVVLPLITLIIAKIRGLLQ